jgi:DNA-binding NarL/FixJ family response regulator
MSIGVTNRPQVALEGGVERLHCHLDHSNPARRRARGAPKGGLVIVLKYDSVLIRAGEAGFMKILVVDDHVLIRDALREILKVLKNDAVVLETSDCGQTMRLIEQHGDIELILLDLTLPDGSGLEMLAKLRDRHPSVGIVVLSAYHDRENVEKVLDLGALGFIPKSAEGAVMRGALQLIFAGGIYVPPEILAGRGSRLPEPPKRTAAAGPTMKPIDRGLTDRQVEVLALMMQGCSNKAICRILEVAEPTVKNHVSAILKALNVTTRTEAVIAVGQLGWQLKLPRTVKAQQPR